MFCSSHYLFIVDRSLSVFQIHLLFWLTQCKGHYIHFYFYIHSRNKCDFSFPVPLLLITYIDRPLNHQRRRIPAQRTQPGLLFKIPLPSFLTSCYAIMKLNLKLRPSCVFYQNLLQKKHDNVYKTDEY